MLGVKKEEEKIKKVLGSLQKLALQITNVLLQRRKKK
jgi:hypothetical protein